MESQDKCDFIYPNGEQCFRLREPGAEHCICHLKDKNKDPEKFWAEFDKVLNGDSKKLDFSGFYFLPDRGFVLPEHGTIDTDVSFEGATFTGLVTFEVFTFKGYVNFNNAIFLEHAYIWSIFEKDASFVNTTFEKKVNFANSTFYGRADLAGFKGVLEETRIGTFSKKEESLK